MLAPELAGRASSLNGFEIPDEPTRASVDVLVANLRADHARRSVSPTNDAHRSRVIRQQRIMMERNEQLQALENSKRDGKRLRREARPADHRDEGGQG